MGRSKGILELRWTFILKSQGAAKNAANNEAQAGTAGGGGTAAVKLDLSKVKVEPLFEDMVDFDTFSRSDFRVVKVKACEAVPKSRKLLQFTLDDGNWHIPKMKKKNGVYLAIGMTGIIYYQYKM